MKVNNEWINVRDDNDWDTTLTWDRANELSTS